MDENKLVMTWLLWHQAVEYIKQDLPKVESADLRFPFPAGGLLRQLGNTAYAKEQAMLKELKANRIRIVKEKIDQGEVFIVWSQRGTTDIFRITEGKLRIEVQKKINELMMEMIPGQKDDPSPH